MPTWNAFHDSFWRFLLTTPREAYATGTGWWLSLYLYVSSLFALQFVLFDGINRHCIQQRVPI